MWMESEWFLSEEAVIDLWRQTALEKVTVISSQRQPKKTAG